MSRIFTIHNNSSKVAIIKSLRNTVQIGDQAFLLDDLNPTIARFTEFWELMETIKRHGYLRAAMSVVGRSAVGAWWTLRRHSEYGKKAPERHRRRLFDFYMMRTRQWDNIKDFQNFAYKLMIGVMYLRYFGQAAFHVIHDENDAPIGLDFLHGLVVPNVDSQGKFKNPAFVQYPTNDLSVKVEYEDPRDIVFITNPDWEGSPMGGTDIEALATYTLPLDIYLLTAARDYMKNRDRPEVVYELASDISDEGFDEFVAEMEARHRGAANLGRNPIAVQGEFKVHELRPYPDSLPYQDSRKDTREEELAVAGVSGSKLGITTDMANANLKEMRREFHETSLMPLMMLIEIAFYEQIHVREFQAEGWEFKFNRPDFLTAVEKATVHMRYKQMGVLNPNEIRYELGKEPREGGDVYVDEDVENSPGSPPEGRETEPDAPSEVGEPTLDDQDPVRGDQHDDETREEMLNELVEWKRFALRRMKRGKTLREYETLYIPLDVRDIIQEHIELATTPDELAEMFNVAFSELMGGDDGSGN